MELWKDACDILSIFGLVSLFLCLPAFLSKWDTAISNLLKVALLTVFFHTVVVLTITLMQLKGGHTQGRQLRQMQLLWKWVIFIQCAHCSVCVFPQLQYADQQTIHRRSWQFNFRPKIKWICTAPGPIRDGNRIGLLCLIFLSLLMNMAFTELLFWEETVLQCRFTIWFCNRLFVWCGKEDRLFHA